MVTKPTKTGIHRRVNQLFFEPVEIYPLVVFRILFGLVTFIGTVRFWWLGRINEQYITPHFHFTYYGFEWVKPLGFVGMHLVFILLAVCSLAIAVGYFFRTAAILFFLFFVYVELIDKTYYLNHYYLISILSLVLIFLPAHKFFSFDAYQKRTSGTTYIPAWCILLIKFQICLVYLYAGLAKINADWLLHALPLRIWLPAFTDFPIIGRLFIYSEVAYFFSWSAMLFDCLIPFFLWNTKTRTFAFILVVVFHAITSYMFPIGIFPLIMSSFVLLFFSNHFHKAILFAFIDKLRLRIIPVGSVFKFGWKKAQFVFLAVFIAFQVFFPWRYLLYPGNIFWTEEGYRFSWRVMLMEKTGYTTFWIRDGMLGRAQEVANEKFLTNFQEKQMAIQPDMVLEYSQYLCAYFKKQGMKNPVVKVEDFVSLNGRPSKLLINPSINLAAEKNSLRHKKWITEFKN